MASSSATLRFADIVSVKEFIEGQENENTRKKTEQNIALLTLKGEFRALEDIPPWHTQFIHQRIRYNIEKEKRQRKLWAQFVVCWPALKGIFKEKIAATTL